MPRRSPLWLGFAALALAVLAACNDNATQPPSSVGPSTALSGITLPNCKVGRIAQLGTVLSPVRSRAPDFDLNASMTTILTLAPTQLKIAQGLALKLAAVLADTKILDKLSTPPAGFVPPTKEGAVSELVNLVFDCVGLTPPGDISGAYSSGGGGKVIGSAGGTLTTRDGHALLVVPDGAVTGDHFFSISPKTALAKARNCLQTTPASQVPGQYNQCYGYVVSPDASFAKSVTIGMCTLDEVATSAHPYGTPSSAVHNRLHIASVDHDDHSKIRIYDTKEVSGLVCNGFDISSAPQRHGDGLLGSALALVANVMDRATSPFRPKLAYAFDGVGTLLDRFTDYTTVDNVAFESGFEDGETRVGALPGSPAEALRWSTDLDVSGGGFWNRTPGSFANTAYSTYVSTIGSTLPAPKTGLRSLWFGEASQGNFMGAQKTGDFENSGGTSVDPHSGRAISPAFGIPNTKNQVVLRFQSWFEIESINPSGFDLMRVEIQDVASDVAPTPLITLNPVADPADRAKNIAWTSAGLNVQPAWQLVTVDLGKVVPAPEAAPLDFRGKTVRLHFVFDTRDRNYNGFRGWLVDDVQVKAVAERLLASSSPTPIAPRRSEMLPPPRPLPEP
jgi:hypothetical protein